jgi:predicted RNase H-like nuclease
LLAVGLDGFRSRWLAVCLEDGAFSDARVFSSLKEAVDAFGSASAFGVDIPIGPPESSVRDADRCAREFVESRRSSVFPMPPRWLIDEACEYQEALRRCREKGAPGVSRQAFGLLPKIREAAALADDQRIWEVHPEVSFREMSGSALQRSKKTWAGQQERMELLAREGISIPADIGPAGSCPADDVLDAAAAAWSANRIARGHGQPLPPGAARMGAIWR